MKYEKVACITASGFFYSRFD
jgi:hypothetical protein